MSARPVRGWLIGPLSAPFPGRRANDAQSLAAISYPPIQSSTALPGAVFKRTKMLRPRPIHPGIVFVRCQAACTGLAGEPPLFDVVVGRERAGIEAAEVAWRH